MHLLMGNSTHVNPKKFKMLKTGGSLVVVQNLIEIVSSILAGIDRGSFTFYLGLQ